MSFEVTIAGTKLPTDSSALKGFRDDLNLAFNLGSEFASLLDGAISKVPSANCKTNVDYKSPSASWNPGASPVKFGLQGGASGALEVISSGDLITYTDGLDSPKQKSITIAANTVYLKLTLNFTISANASATYSGGAYGVKAALSTEDTYAISFCKAFAPDTLLRSAIAQTFESFVLPLHEKTLGQLSDGDYLQHKFDGNLHLSFGAYAGIDRVLYAGQSSVDVIKSFGSPLAKFTACAKPTIKAGVSLDFTFQYATKFEALLSKVGPTARLHLFRSEKTTTSTVLKATLSFDANAAITLTPDKKHIQDSLVQSAASAGKTASDAVSKIASSASSEIDKAASEVTDKLNSWIKRANGIQTNLQIAIETSNSKTLLAGYDFDLSSPQFDDAWKAAVDGDFVKAFNTGAVTLDIGSGLEDAYQRKTSFSIKVFNLWSMKSWDEFSSKVSLVYAGNNIFHLVANIGRTTETDSMGAMHSMDMYFAATADVSGAGASSNIVIDLHIDLTAQKDPKAAARIARMINAMRGGPAFDAIARDMTAFATNSANGTAKLEVTIPKAAYARIACDPYDSDKPLDNNTDHDAANWAAFAKAADDLSAWPLQNLSTLSAENLAFLKTFSAWISLNENANGTDKPNRVDSGNPQGHWPENFPDLATGSRTAVINSMLAGQSFMNFCADLFDLVKTEDPTSAGITWNALLKKITQTVKNDIDVDFMRPTALAVIRLCKSPASTITGPTGVNVPTDHFSVTISL